MRKIQAVWGAALLCGSLTAYGKDAGWQWYNDPVKLPDPKTTEKPAQVRQEPDIMQKLSALQTATKRALYEAIPLSASRTGMSAMPGWPGILWPR